MGFKVEGFDEIDKALKSLDIAVGLKALQTAGRKAMKPVLDYQLANVNVETGDTKSSLGMTARKGGRSNKKRVVLISVGSVKKTTGKGADKRKLVNVHQKVIAQEFGNNQVKAKPFIRPSLNTQLDGVISRLKSEFKKNLEKVKR